MYNVAPHSQLYGLACRVPAGSRALRASDDGSFLRTLPTSRYASPMNPSKHSGYYPSNAAYGAGGDLTWPGPRSRLQRAPDAGLLTGAPEGSWHRRMH